MPVIEFGAELEHLTQTLAGEMALAAGATHRASAKWAVYGRDPADQPLDVVASASIAYSTRYVAELGGGFAEYLINRSGELYATCWGDSIEHAQAVLAELRAAIPAAENADASTIPVTFWTYGSHGPRSIERQLDAPAWQEIVPNYAAPTLERLGTLFAPDFEPGHGGQFVLWHGEPGTGKTTALRALAREWRTWCRPHYIADPDQFFGQHADYMLDVLLQGEYDEPDDGVKVGRWRLLILEDTAELLYADAKREVGQALSRFLNCVDGMIGQGLRVLVLVTTNEPLGKLHPAVTRPGRSALAVEFAPLSGAEAVDWMRAHDADVVDTGPRILADLYASVEGFAQRMSPARVGF